MRNNQIGRTPQKNDLGENLPDALLPAGVTAKTGSEARKSCCVQFYENPVVDLLLDGSFHPGGEVLSQKLAVRCMVRHTHHVVDLACGKGTTTIRLAARFQCKVTGVDLSRKNLEAARQAARDHGVGELCSFVEGDAEHIPLEPGSAHTVISECAFCTFPDKQKAAAEIHRILKPGGRFGMTDMAVNAPLSDTLQGLLSYVLCIADARSRDEYQAILAHAGFGRFQHEDESRHLADLCTRIHRKLQAASLLKKFTDIGVPDQAIHDGRKTLVEAQSAIQQDQIGYLMLIAKK